MWFHLTTIRLYLPNADSVKETLHSEEFTELVTEYGGRASYVLECPENSAEFNFLTLWDCPGSVENGILASMTPLQKGDQAPPQKANSLL